MSRVLSDSLYSNYVTKFNNSTFERRWGIFKKLHLRISKKKCPYCEQNLTNILNDDSQATIDHYRPKAATKYPSLKYDVNNYILMCRLCNSDYKNADFPLEVASVSARVPNINLLLQEKPLLLNLIYDNPLEYFVLVFTTYTSVGSILELKVKDNLSIYKNNQAQKMLYTFGLGSPTSSKSVSHRVQQSRYTILKNHYNTFIDLAKAIQNKDEEVETIIDNNPNLQKYGFFEFLINEDFIIL